MNLLENADYLPVQLDPLGQRVLFVRLDAAQRVQASFLDERVLSGVTDGAWVPWQVVIAAGAGRSGAAPAHAIFHIGHCGSTLLSRVLDAAPGLQALREPLPLRTLAEAWETRGDIASRFGERTAAAMLDALWAFWSRPTAGGRQVVIKATSSCNGLVAPVLQRHPRTRVVLLDMPLRPYLAAMLKSASSLQDGVAAAAGRLRHLHRAGFAQVGALHAMSPLQQCAMGWWAEQVRFDALAQSHGPAVLRLGFDALLDSRTPALRSIAAHLGLGGDAVEHMLGSAAWTRYAKAPEHGYGQADRAHDLALSEHRYAGEIESAIRWLDGVRAA